jgi:4-alpha-glucanotransferase
MGAPGDQPYRCAAFPRRTAGAVLHVTSLPGRGPVGDLGAAARDWVDALADMGLGWWQICPLGPTGYGDSPYQPLSTSALNPHLIDLGELVEEGLVTADELMCLGRPGGVVDHGLLWTELRPLLAQAAARAAQDPARLARWGALDAFRAREAAWLPAWCRFAALREANGFRAPAEWGRAEPEEGAGERAAILQLVADAQWASLRDHARRRGVRVLGDMPIYVSADGGDRWSRPDLFSTEEVAGVPPDYFSEDGQLWGNPLHDWARQAEDGFAWWRARVDRDLRLFDAARIDHFRGLCDYWAVPRGATSAREGQWRPGPGMAFFRALGDRPLVAEDLGLLSPGVHALRAEAGLPGMAVLQFGFPRTEDNPHHPEAITSDRVAYTGTHDNDTTAGWFAGLSPEAAREARSALGEGPVADAAWRAVLASPAIAAFAPAQDLLGLGSEARLNTPGVAQGNWRWRMTEAQLGVLRETTEGTRRLVAEAGRGG